MNYLIFSMSYAATHKNSKALSKKTACILLVLYALTLPGSASYLITPA